MIEEEILFEATKDISTKKQKETNKNRKISNENFDILKLFDNCRQKLILLKNLKSLLNVLNENRLNGTSSQFVNNKVNTTNW